MRFNVEMSLRGASRDPDYVVPVARALESAGFSMLGYTDHPAPSKKWLESGGHPTYDPFAALSFVAGVTSTIRLMTYLAVLPYRNPLVTARAVATVDRLSRGRFTLVVGSGYLKGEFFALGSDFDTRNDAVDEALEVLTQVFATDSFDYQGNGWNARDVIVDPGPVQLPHPPIWVGGSSRKSRERVARFGQGWAPLMTTEQSRRTTRSAVMATVADLGARIKELRSLVEGEGRDPDGISVQIDGLATSMSAGLENPAQHLEMIEELSAVGVTDVLLRPPADDTAGGLIEEYGAQIISKATS